MTGNVTSIVQARAAARRRSDRFEVNTRVAVTLLVVVGVLVVVGLGATLSASSVVGITQASDGLYFFKRQAMWVGLGLVALLIGMRIPYRWYRKAALPMFVGVLALLVAVLLVSDERNGAARWLQLGPLSLQPSEPAKFATVVFLAALMVKKERLLGDLGHFLAPVAISIGLVAGLLMLQPDLGTTIIVGAAAMTVLTVSLAPLGYVVFTGLLSSLAATGLALAAPYRRARLLCFLDPFADPLGDCYQLIQSYLALGTGGTLGVGLGASRARWLFLPNAHTDFIFSIIGEETGFVGAVVVLILLAILTVVGFVIALRAPDRFGRMVAAGLTAWLSVQALVNIGGVVGVIPITGIALPFVSFGGSALLAAMAAVGVLYNIAVAGVSRSQAGRAR